MIYRQKRFHINQLRRKINNMRERNKSVVFTNGCFDLLHAGHVHQLESARFCGDMLVVGLNSDESIKRIKGNFRPIIDQEQRIQMLCALECVDAVHVFDENDACALITEIQPDIYIKGADYLSQHWPEADIVRSYGGIVMVMPRMYSISTSSIIERVRRLFG